MRIFLIALASAALLFFLPFPVVFIAAAAAVASTGPYEYRRVEEEDRDP